MGKLLEVLTFVNVLFAANALPGMNTCFELEPAL